MRKERRTILIYGDSNTFGYDPADWTTFRYPREKRWITLLQGLLGDAWQVEEEGRNGRCLPVLSHDEAYLGTLLGRLPEEGIFSIMLGTNDILSSFAPNANDAIARMEDLLAFLKRKIHSSQILVITPPPSGQELTPDPLYRNYWQECIRMNRGFRRLSETYGTMFVDAGTWEIPLCSDLVHFSEEGHRIFAENMYRFLRGLE